MPNSYPNERELSSPCDTNTKPDILKRATSIPELVRRLTTISDNEHPKEEKQTTDDDPNIDLYVHLALTN